MLKSDVLNALRPKNLGVITIKDNTDTLSEYRPRSTVNARTKRSFLPDEEGDARDFETLSRQSYNNSTLSKGKKRIILLNRRGEKLADSAHTKEGFGEAQNSPKKNQQ